MKREQTADYRDGGQQIPAEPLLAREGDEREGDEPDAGSQAAPDSAAPWLAGVTAAPCPSALMATLELPPQDQ